MHYLTVTANGAGAGSGTGNGETDSDSGNPIRINLSPEASPLSIVANDTTTSTEADTEKMPTVTSVRTDGAV